MIEGLINRHSHQSRTFGWAFCMLLLGRFSLAEMLMRNVLVHGVRPIYLESLHIHTEHCRQQDNPIHALPLWYSEFLWGRKESFCYAPCSSDTDGCRPTRLHSDSIGPPSVTLGTPGTVLHNLSWDTGDLFTSLSFLLYLLIFPMPRSDYLPRVFLMFSLIYFRSSSSSSINSSTIVGSTQMKNLVVFQFRLRANSF